MTTDRRTATSTVLRGLLAALAFGAATLGAFVVSTTVGLFGVNERWEGVPQILSAVSEVVAIVLALAALVVEAPLRRTTSSRLSAARPPRP